MRFVLAGAAILIAQAAVAAEGDIAKAKLHGAGITGTLTMTDTASGMVHVAIAASGVPEGVHGLHVHETGRCEAEDGFKSAGGHLALGRQHGVKSAQGPHPGDLPNVHVQADGELRAEFFARGFDLGDNGETSLFDDDGSAVVLHSGPDDYASQPSGQSGDRIACGILARGG